MGGEQDPAKINSVAVVDVIIKHSLGLDILKAIIYARQSVYGSHATFCSSTLNSGTSGRADYYSVDYFAGILLMRTPADLETAPKYTPQKEGGSAAAEDAISADSIIMHQQQQREATSFITVMQHHVMHCFHHKRADPITTRAARILSSRPHKSEATGHFTESQEAMAQSDAITTTQAHVGAAAGAAKSALSRHAAGTAVEQIQCLKGGNGVSCYHHELGGRKMLLQRQRRLL
jgi:hypothetical protein